MKIRTANSTDFQNIENIRHASWDVRSSYYLNSDNGLKNLTIINKFIAKLELTESEATLVRGNLLSGELHYHYSIDALKNQKRQLNQDLKESVEENPENTLIAIIDDIDVGIVNYKIDEFESEKAIKIDFLALTKDAIGKDVAKTLMTEIDGIAKTQEIKTVFLYCDAENLVACSFYKNQGFNPLLNEQQERKRFQEDGYDDYIILSKKLPN